MEEFILKRAITVDVPALVELRLVFLAEVTAVVPTDRALSDALTRYFSAAIPGGQFIAFLAIAGNQVIATSGLVFHHVPPSLNNLAGLNGYIMNMYTLPLWRGKGIASALLHELVAVARQSNCGRITLHAEVKAVALYRRAGFAPREGEMQLDLR